MSTSPDEPLQDPSAPNEADVGPAGLLDRVSWGTRKAYLTTCGLLSLPMIGLTSLSLLFFADVGGDLDPFTPGVLIIEVSGALAVAALICCFVGGKRIDGSRWARPAIIALVCLLLSFLCLAASPFVASWWEERQRDKQWESVYQMEWADTDVH
jgi:hypothetical protein